MNKTKWTALCNAFSELASLNIKVRYKLISSDQLYGFSTVWWHELMEDSAIIEWLEFDPIVKEYQGRLIKDKETNRLEIILKTLHLLDIQYTKEESYIRIWGYLNQCDSTCRI